MNFQTPLSPILYAKILGSSGGTGTDSDAVHYTADSGKTDSEKAQARANIDAVSLDDIGTVFTLKGSVATVADLDNVSDPQVGDVYYVDAVSAGYIWMTSESEPDGYWEELGETIDLSAYQLKPVVNLPAGATVSITPVDNNVYNCGTLTSLTVSSAPVTGSYVIKFDSGNTATTTTIPNTIHGLESFAAEANTHYEINVEDNYAVIGSWAVSA